MARSFGKSPSATLGIILMISLLGCLYLINTTQSKTTILKSDSVPDRVRVKLEKKQIKNDSRLVYTLKKSASSNLGQHLRQDNAVNVLKKQNHCPEQYTLPKDISNKFKDLQQVSNYDQRNRTFNKKVVILTPVSSYEKGMLHYFQLLCSLTYPHHLISVALGEDSSKDKTLHVTSMHAKQLSQYFNNISVHHFNMEMPPNKYNDDHIEIFQLKRRTHLAKARNNLLFKGLGDADYVLWIDVDVKYVPPDLIQILMSYDKPVIAPSCMYLSSKGLDVYDRNTWQETERSRAYLKSLKEGDLRLEGYTTTMRKYLPHLKTEGKVVPLDGIGGCILMVKGEYHRQGLIFPTFVFKNHIETEGLAQMAAKMGIGVFGLPYVSVVHW